MDVLFRIFRGKLSATVNLYALMRVQASMGRTAQVWTLMAIVLLWLAPRTCPGDDWPQWRGLHRDGISAEKDWVTVWPDAGPKVLWKSSVGAGNSSVAVVGGRLYTMGFVAETGADAKPRKTPDGTQIGTDTIWCLDANTGAVLWKHSYPALGDATYSTPTVDRGCVYTVGRSGPLYCLDAVSGRVIWSKDLVKDFGGKLPYWNVEFGHASSPLVMGDVSIVECGGSQAQFLGLGRKTGNIIWKWGVGGETGYSSPVAYDAGGKPGAILMNRELILGVDPATGAELWRYRGHLRGMNTCATPNVHGDKIFMPGGWDGPKNRISLLLQLTPQGPKAVWENENLLNFFQSAVLVDGYLYGTHVRNWHSTCSLRCVNFETGEVKWDHEGMGHAALIAANGKLIIMGEHGELVVAEASPAGYKQLAHAQVIGGQTFVCPVLSDGKIFCRNNAGDMVCVDVRQH